MSSHGRYHSYKPRVKLNSGFVDKIIEGLKGKLTKTEREQMIWQLEGLVKKERDKIKRSEVNGTSTPNIVSN